MCTICNLSFIPVGMVAAFDILHQPIPCGSCSQTQHQASWCPYLCLWTHASYLYVTWTSSCLSSYRVWSELLYPLHSGQTVIHFLVFFFFLVFTNGGICFMVTCRVPLQFVLISGNMLLWRIIKIDHPEAKQVCSLYELWKTRHILCWIHTAHKITPNLADFRGIRMSLERPFHRVVNRSVTVSLFERYNFWNFLFKCWTAE
jgi:hypothetical protein